MKTLALHSIAMSTLTGLLLAGLPAPSSAAEFNPVAREPAARRAQAHVEVIVKLRSDQTQIQGLAKAMPATARTAALGKRTGLTLSLRREISAAMLAASIDLQGADPDQAIEALRADESVAHVSLDRRRYIHATTPNDPLFVGQWYLQATEPSAVNAIGAWDRELGSAGVVVAVLDTGILYGHPDLGRGDTGGRLLPGFDFVSGTLRANDGGGRDPDPTDPGDWIDDSDQDEDDFSDCDATGSSWHGTRVAGMIGALTNNATGVSGLSWTSWILPVRVLGKCGGSDSDIIAGMRWAAGLAVPGVPLNPTPARVLNLSLGSTSSCEFSYRDVIEELTARKVLVVISAGNEGTQVSSPANCPGVAAIAALRHAGSKVGFSNLGPEVTLGAPGGNCVNINGGPCLFSLDTTSNAGTKAAGSNTFTNQFNSNLGTSFSAPIVSGVAALMLSRNANLTTGQMLERLRQTARPFPTAVAGEPTVGACHVPVNTSDVQLEQCLCTTATCGAGMVDAGAAVNAADRPIAAIALPGNVSPGQDVVLNAGGSAAACNRTVADFGWSVVSPTVDPPVILGADTASATVIAPSSGSITLRLTVTDDQGSTDTADVVIQPTQAGTAAPASAGSTACAATVVSGPTPGGSNPSPTPPAPAPTPRGGGGGGGRLDGIVLLLLVGAAGIASRRRRRGI